MGRPCASAMFNTFLKEGATAPPHSLSIIIVPAIAPPWGRVLRRRNGPGIE